MITLADLRARNALPSWQEAVAIVQELVEATVQAHGSAAGLPDIEHIGLGADGTVSVLPGSPVPDNPVRHLAVILDLLLEDVSAPPQLVAIGKRNCEDPPQAATVGELTKALAFFERPGRRDDIAELVARASVAEEQTRADEELRRLKARALESEKPREDEPAPVVPPRRRLLVPIVAAVAVVVAALSGVLLWQARARSSASQAGESETAVNADANGTERETTLLSRISSVVRTAAASLTGSSGAAPVELPPVPPAPKEPEEKRRPSRAAVNAARNIRDSGAAAPPDAVAIITTELGGHPFEPDDSPPVETVIAPENVFTSGDLNVLPPTIVRPVIPPPPGPNAPADTVALFDLLVDRQGRVEQVLLASEPSRFHERMLLSHIKTWMFQPAMKDGRPVRYRLRILLSV